MRMKAQKHSKKSLIEKKLKINYIMNYKMKIFINKTLIIKLIKTNMKNIDRVVVTKLEIFENELVALHALEIINNIITGIYFQAYLKKDIRKNNDRYYLYYLSEYQYYGDNYLQNFIDFIDDSKIVTYNDQ